MPAKKSRKAATPTRIEVPLTGNLDAPHFNPHQVRILNTALDFVLVLAQMKIGPDGQPTMESVATVGVSPAHLKALAILLAGKVEEYEKEYGILPTVPPA